MNTPLMQITGVRKLLQRSVDALEGRKTLDADDVRYRLEDVVVTLKNVEDDLRTTVGTPRLTAEDQTPEEFFLGQVFDEFHNAKRNYPGNKDLFASVIEEVGEVARTLKGKQPISSLRGELVQTAALLLRIAVEGDASFPETLPGAVGT